MALGNKLAKLRREKQYTQEQLAELLGVSRQAISKWESDTAYPETDKLIRMSELFDCSLDYLLKDGTAPEPPQSPVPPVSLFQNLLRERKSTKTLRGVPLWHIGRRARGIFAIGWNARGVVAIGLKATGVVSFGLLSLGLLSFGMLSLGLIAFGLFAIGGLSAGCIAAGILTAGAISFGVISLGAIAVGDFSVGALAIGRYFALGDHARGMVALGDTEAVGSLFEKVGTYTAADLAAGRELLESVVPSYLSWAVKLLFFFL